MFNNKADNESDFCESYKSQILNNNSKEKESLFSSIFKILTILLLLAVIIAISIYGYNYFVNSSKKTQSSEASLPPVSIQVSDDDLKVIDEVVEVEKESSIPAVSKIKESDIDQIANDVKLAIANSEKADAKGTDKNDSEEKNISKEENLEVPISGPEAQYLEELADLSRQIDKDREK